VNRAATGTTGQIELGRLAEQRGFAPAVRSFGGHIAAEHARAHARLIALSQRFALIPTARNPDLSRLTALSGPQFDQQFMADQVKNQQEALALFEGEAQNGQEPQLRRFAREWLPILRRDLQRAEVITTRTGS